MDDPRAAFAAMTSRASTWLSALELQLVLDVALPAVSAEDLRALGEAICARAALREMAERVPM